MSKKYQNMLSPIKVGNTVFKNRLIASRSSASFDTEPYPTEALVTNYASRARNGAASVTCGGVGMAHFIPDKALELFSPERMMPISPGSYQIYDMNCQRHLSQLTEV